MHTFAVKKTIFKGDCKRIKCLSLIARTFTPFSCVCTCFSSLNREVIETAAQAKIRRHRGPLAGGHWPVTITDNDITWP